jgi:hypothetical protein
LLTNNAVEFPVSLDTKKKYIPIQINPAVEYSLEVVIVKPDVENAGIKRKLTAAKIGLIEGKKSRTVFRAINDTIKGKNTAFTRKTASFDPNTCLRKEIKNGYPGGKNVCGEIPSSLIILLETCWEIFR